MIAGWTGVLFFTFLLAVLAPDLGTSGWIGLSIMNQIFLMLAGDDDNLSPSYIRQGSGDRVVACMLQTIHLLFAPSSDRHCLLQTFLPMDTASSAANWKVWKKKDWWVLEQHARAFIDAIDALRFCRLGNESGSRVISWPLSYKPSW